MAILLYQIGIIIAIQIASFFGKNSRNTAVILISIFTILQIYISWLLLLQFVTIIISWSISNNLFFKKKSNDKVSNKATYPFRNQHDELSDIEIKLGQEKMLKAKEEYLNRRNDRKRKAIQDHLNSSPYKKVADEIINNSNKK